MVWGDQSEAHQSLPDCTFFVQQAMWLLLLPAPADWFCESGCQHFSRDSPNFKALNCNAKINIWMFRSVSLTLFKKQLGKHKMHRFLNKQTSPCAVCINLLAYHYPAFPPLQMLICLIGLLFSICFQNWSKSLLYKVDCTVVSSPLFIEKWDLQHTWPGHNHQIKLK